MSESGQAVEHFYKRKMQLLRLSFIQNDQVLWHCGEYMSVLQKGRDIVECRHKVIKLARSLSTVKKFQL